MANEWPGKVIRIATDRSWNCDHALAHEIGHVLRLANALDEAGEPCGTDIMGGRRQPSRRRHAGLDAWKRR